METITHQGNIIEVVQKEVEVNGKKKVFEYARRSPGVRIIVPKDDTILLTREFRSELNTYDYRLPGGKVYDALEDYNKALSDGVPIEEAAKNAAIKEAKEEAGIDVTDMSFIHKSVCGATVMWDLFYFVANEFTETSQHLEDGEDITFQFVNKEEAIKMCLRGDITEERSALVLLRYLNTSRQ